VAKDKADKKKSKSKSKSKEVEVKSKKKKASGEMQLGSLATTYRPNTLNDLVGQEQTVRRFAVCSRAVRCRNRF
jgi:replication-associated recombination protein RarA